MRAIRGPVLIAAFLVALWMVFVAGNPGGITNAKYSRFKQLAPPKLLYSCTRTPTSEALLRRARACADSGRSGCELKVYEEGKAETETVVEFIGSRGASTYDELLEEARRDCAESVADMGNGKLEVLEAVKK